MFCECVLDLLIISYNQGMHSYVKLYIFTFMNILMMTAHTCSADISQDLKVKFYVPNIILSTTFIFLWEHFSYDATHLYDKRGR